MTFEDRPYLPKILQDSISPQYPNPLNPLLEPPQLGPIAWIWYTSQAIALGCFLSLRT